MAPSRKTKQTVRNNAFLRTAKALWNAPTYARVNAMVNDASDPVAGELEATRWLRQFTRSGQAEIAAERALAIAMASDTRMG